MKVVVGRVSDFDDDDRRIVDVNGKSIGIFRVGGRFYAIRNRCPHQAGPLCVGRLAQRPVADAPGEVAMDDGAPLLACPWHGWEYDLATGQSFMGPGRGNHPARNYDVTVLPGAEVPDTAAVASTRTDGRVPGPYVAETVPITIEEEYLLIED